MVDRCASKPALKRESDGKWPVRVTFAGEVYEYAASSEAEAKRIGGRLARSLLEMAERE